MAITTTANKIATGKWSNATFGAASLCSFSNDKCITVDNIDCSDNTVQLPGLSDDQGALPESYTLSKYIGSEYHGYCLTQDKILEEYQDIDFNVNCDIIQINPATSQSQFVLQKYRLNASLLYFNEKDNYSLPIINGGINTPVNVTITLTYSITSFSNKGYIIKEIAKASETITCPVPSNSGIISHDLFSYEVSNSLVINKPTESNPNLNLTISEFLGYFGSEIYESWSSGNSSAAKFSVVATISPTAHIPTGTIYKPTIHNLIGVNTSAISTTEDSTLLPDTVISYNNRSGKTSDNKICFATTIKLYSPRIVNTTNGAIDSSIIDSLSINLSNGTFDTFNKSISYNFNKDYDEIHLWGLATPSSTDGNVDIYPTIDIAFSPSGYNSLSSYILLENNIQLSETTLFNNKKNQFLTITAINDSTISFSGGDIWYISPNVITSRNYNGNGTIGGSGSVWIKLTQNATLSIRAGNSYCFKASGITPTSSAGIGRFTITGKCDISGNVISMLYGDNTADGLTGKNYAFRRLFYNCTGIQKVANNFLPATTLATYCYYQMFYGCTNLIEAPELPATTLATYCYYGMFRGCTGLSIAPKLPAVTLVSSCYNYMFYGCTKLSYIEAYFTTTPSSSYTNNWVTSVALNGLFIKSPNATWTTTGASGVPSGWVSTNNNENYMGIVALEDNTTIDFLPTSSYPGVSSDNGLSFGALRPTTISKGEFLLFESNLTPSDINGIGTFNVDKSFAVFGNCHKLLSSKSPRLNYSLSKLFNNNIGLKYVTYDCLNPLNGTSIGEYAYNQMFYGCVNLVNAPKLPVLSIYTHCYYNMFKGCSNLAIAPKLPAKNLNTYCYYGMFENCTSLVKAPELPATTLSSYCYTNMFYGCTSLITAPELPAKTLTTSCYNAMFQNCTNLEKAPDLPAQTLVNWCYGHIFENCQKINKIKAMCLTTPTGDYTNNWVNGVASSGTFIKNSEATWANKFGNDYIPTGWTVEYAN